MCEVETLTKKEEEEEGERSDERTTRKMKSNAHDSIKIVRYCRHDKWEPETHSFLFPRFTDAFIVY